MTKYLMRSFFPAISEEFASKLSFMSWMVIIITIIIIIIIIILLILTWLTIINNNVSFKFP